MTDKKKPRPARKGRPRAEESLEMDERIKTSALDHFLQAGFDAVSMDTIAASAGITKRTLYARYVDKATLFREVLTWAMVQWRELNLALDIDQTGKLSIEDELIRVAEVLLERELNIKVVQLARIATSQSERFPDLFRQVDAGRSMAWSPRLQAISTILARRQALGEIAVDEPELVAELFISLIMGIPARLAAFGVFREASYERHRIEEAVKLFLNGVRVTEKAMGRARR